MAALKAVPLPRFELHCIVDRLSGAPRAPANGSFAACSLFALTVTTSVKDAESTQYGVPQNRDLSIGTRI